MIKYEEQFHAAVSSSRKGDNEVAISQFQKMIQRYPQRYTLYTNLGCLYIKGGQTQLAVWNFSRAVQIDPFHYAAYYNRFMCRYQQKKLAQGLQDLQKALSCLYASKAKKQKSQLYALRSLQICRNNLQSLILKAQFQPQTALAQNLYLQIQKMIESLNQGFKQRALSQLYASKICYYEQRHDKEQIKLNKKRYLQVKKNIQELKVPQNINYQLMTSSPTNLSDDQMLDRIQKLSWEIKNERQHCWMKQERPQIKVKQLERQQKGNAGQINIKQMIYQAVQMDIHKFEVQKKAHIENTQNSNFEVQNASSVPSLNESSNFLNEQIKKLQTQIQQEGGKLQVTKIQSRENRQINQSAQEKILEEQILKAMEQIGNQDIKEEVSPSKKQQSRPNPLPPLSREKSGNLNDSKKSNKSFPPRPQKITKTKSVTILDESLSPQQKLIEEAIIQKQRASQAWLKHYISFNLQLFCFKLFSVHEKSTKTFYCLCEYAGLQGKTKPIRSDQKWTFSFNQEIVLSKFVIKIELYEKGGFWSADTVFAKGQIHLLQKDATKCILYSKDGKEKLGILHFKLSYE